jgi:two-component system, NtrC family, nitrogen regulation response regulator NtrX
MSISSPVQILVIDDQLGAANSPHQRSFLRAYANTQFNFNFESCGIKGRFETDKALQALKKYPETDLILLDIKFGSEDDRLGYKILPLLTTQFPAIPVLIMSSVDRDIESLGRCLEDGAMGFISKDQKPEAFHKNIEKNLAIAHSHVLIGHSPRLRELRRQAARLSPYDQIPVLIVGERGTGKDIVARYIHHSGPRSQGPFIAMNCAAIPETLVEAELFGAEKGAYTGADTTRIGYLERAKGGVLFLDEIGNMSLPAQAKLLRVLQDRTFRRVGVSDQELSADIQIIGATNVEPDVLIQNGRLREDFYDRVAAVTISTPPLRDCIIDLPELTAHFLREMGVEGKKRLSRPVVLAMEKYAWPGNIRELRRVIQEAVVRSEQSIDISLDDLPPAISKKALHKSAYVQSAPGGSLQLSEDSAQWPRTRILSELQMAVTAKRRIQAYKGNQWKAEFMRLVYPECKAASAKGFNDLIRRFTKGPWGFSGWKNDKELRRFLEELQQ